MTKTCGKCLEIKTLGSFHKFSNSKDGHSSQCKSCASAYSKRYREVRAEKLRQYRVDNKPRIDAANKAYSIANRERLTEYRKRRYTDNQEAIITYRKTNVAKHAAANKIWNDNNVEHKRMLTRNRRALKRGLTEHFTEIEWQQLLDQYGARCMNPLCLTLENLTRDHIVALINGGTDTIDNIQILCGRCNSSKGAHHSIDYRPVLVDQDYAL